MSTPPLACVQYRPPKGDTATARGRLAELVDGAAADGARVVVCPEMATTGYVWSSPDEILPHCEPALGPTFAALAPVAARHRAWVVVGFAERDDTALYNSALVIDDHGELAGCYRKVALFELDRSWANAGSERQIYPTPYGRLCPGICMDLNDPRFRSFLIETGPEVVAFCTNWLDEGDDVLPYWRSRLFGWDGWFIAANSWGEDRGVPFRGESTILGPGGNVLSRAPGSGDAVIHAG